MRGKVWRWTSLKRANEVVEKVLSGEWKSDNVRQARRSCPVCKFKGLLVSKGKCGSIWCVRCGMIAPSNCVFNVKTGKQVRF